MSEPPAPVPADLATLAARFGAALRAEGVPAGPERCERFASAVTLVAPATAAQLYWCAVATLVADPAQLPALDRVFGAVFGGPAPPGGPPDGSWLPTPRRADPAAGRAASAPPHPEAGERRGAESADAADAAAAAEPADSSRQTRFPALAAAAERLAHRDFADLTADELAELVTAMRRLRLAPPPRRSRRLRSSARGGAVDLRATLRRASHTAGQPVRLRRRRPRWRPRRLVVLCDISGSMAPYARAMLQLLYCAAGGAGAARSEVFTFATRLTRLTRVMRHVPPEAALQRAGQAAPDWSGGTRIGAALREFTDRYGARGVARGAVLVIVSDGWDTGDPAELGRQMARLSRLAYRIVWVNPRSAGADYQPLVRGMAAAWPYCDAVVSGHRLVALDEVLAAVGTARPGRDRVAGGSANSLNRPSGGGDTGGSRAGEVDAHA